MPLGERRTRSNLNVPRWLIAVAALALALLACDPWLPTGVTCLIQEPDGSIFAPDTNGGNLSLDGGLTWQTTSQTEYYSYCSHPYPSSKSFIRADPQNPSIQYRFNPAVSIERSDDGGTTWRQEIDLAGAEARTLYYMRFRRNGFEYRVGPVEALFHEPSGNLIVSMSYEGILMRFQNGYWQWVTVGPYSRVDMRDPSVFFPMIFEELTFGALIGLLIFSSLIVLSVRRNLGLVFGLVILSLAVILIIDIAAGYLGNALSSVVGWSGYIQAMTLINVALAAVMAPALLGWWAGKRTKQANLFQLAACVVGWTFLIAGFAEMALTKVTDLYSGWLPAGVVGVILVPVCVANLILRPKVGLKSTLALGLFDAAGFMIFAVCYFLWVIGGIPFHRDATLFVVGLSLLNLIIGSRVLRRLEPLVSSDSLVVSEPAPAELLETT